jgi:glucosamine kinase
MYPEKKIPVHYLIGIDGGGTGTRALLADASGHELGRGSAGPSALSLGADQAWHAILTAIRQAFDKAGLAMPALSEIALGCGLAGVNNKQWAAQFSAKNPGFSPLVIETDAGTTLLGAHLGQPGVIIALGTGSVGEVMLADGSRREVGGWGFPSSDEAGGAWLGLRAMNHVQKTLDGRSAADDFSHALIAYCAAESRVPCEERDAVFDWLGRANQTRFAQLSPIVSHYAASSAKAKEIMLAAGLEVDAMARALDRSGQMPVALCGGVAAEILPYLPENLRLRVIRPHSDGVAGALILLRNYFSSRLPDA